MQIKQGQVPIGPLVLPAALAPAPAAVSLPLGAPALAPGPSVRIAPGPAVTAPAQSIDKLGPAVSERVAPPQPAPSTRSSTGAPATALGLQRPAAWPAAAPKPILGPSPAQRQPRSSTAAAPAQGPLLQEGSAGASAGYPVCLPCTCPSAWAPAPGLGASAALTTHPRAESPSIGALGTDSSARAPPPQEGAFSAIR